MFLIMERITLRTQPATHSTNGEDLSQKLGQEAQLPLLPPRREASTEKDNDLCPQDPAQIQDLYLL